MTTHTLNTLPPKEYLIRLAKELAYAEKEITAGITYVDRAERRDHPPASGTVRDASTPQSLRRPLPIAALRARTGPILR